MKIQRVIEGKDINGVDKNKNEGWSSVWSSLSPAALRVFRACPNPDNNSVKEGARTHTQMQRFIHVMHTHFYDLQAFISKD